MLSEHLEAKAGRHIKLETSLAYRKTLCEKSKENKHLKNRNLIDFQVLNVFAHRTNTA